MGTKREDIIGKKLPNGDYVLSAKDIKAINDISRTLFMKTFGNIDIADITNDFKTMLYRNVIQFPAEGNLDLNFPLYAKFYIPENTKEIKSATLNAVTSKYRTDSAILTAAGAVTLVETDMVKKWAVDRYNEETWEDPPTIPIVEWANPALEPASEWYGNPVFASEYRMDELINNGTKVRRETDGSIYWYKLIQDLNQYVMAATDYYPLQHKHFVTLNAPAHTHNQQDGIRESSVIPASVKIYVNGTKVGADMNGVNVQQNNIDIKQHLTIGAWNEVKITAFNASRITLYGLADIVQQFV